MALKIVIIYGLILIAYSSQASGSKLEFKTIDEKILRSLKKGKIHVNTQVEGSYSKKHKKKMQEFSYYIAGLHPSSCHVGLRKLSRYEEYQKMIGYVKKSTYDPKTKLLWFKLDHKVLPNAFTLSFKLPRIKKPGTYRFEFKKGILPGLVGKINVQKRGNQCLYQTKAYWKGRHTGYFDTLLEFFSDTLSRIAMKKLFRISRF